MELLFGLRLLGDVLASIGDTKPLVEVEPHVTPLNRVGFHRGDRDLLVEILGIEVGVLLVLFIEYGTLLGDDEGGVVLPSLPHPNTHVGGKHVGPVLRIRVDVDVEGLLLREFRGVGEGGFEVDGDDPPPCTMGRVRDGGKDVTQQNR